MNGRIRNTVRNKYFGFIEGDNRKEYFFHREDYLGDWVKLEEQVNQSELAVSFEALDDYPKGPRARNVRLI